MTHFLAKAALAVLVSLGGLAATSSAQAASVDVDVRLGRPHVNRPVVVVRPPVAVRPRVVIRPQVVRPVVVRPVVRGCAPAQALAKASRQGLNRVAISRIGANRVVVTGKSRGVWMKMNFANVRGCPRI